MLQVVVDSLIRTAELSLLAVGVTMTYGMLRFANFAHLEFAAIGAYLALALSTGAGLPLPIAAAIAIVITGFFGIATDFVIFRRLRKAAPIMLMIASFALGIVLRETIRAIWGPGGQSYGMPLVRWRVETWEARPLFITPYQVTVIVTAIVAIVAFYVLLSRTRLGVAMRGTAENAPLAQASGIDTNRVIRWVWFIGAAFAALGGVLVGLNTQIKPDMGGGLIIEVFAAAILGGIGNPYGAMLGALLIGFAENVSVAINWGPILQWFGFDAGDFVFIPTGYKAASAFVLLILALLIRPQGLLGAKR
ncbi:MAG: branched-chain amino acid ABC transporter permease [Bauldia sp.]|nr:branched-chain amino acid ABC transporter permease [Bauldia sp.]